MAFVNSPNSNRSNLCNNSNFGNAYRFILQGIKIDNIIFWFSNVLQYSKDFSNLYSTSSILPSKCYILAV